jgi:hypothetical protein
MSELQDRMWEIIGKNIPKLMHWWSQRPIKQAVVGAAALMFWPDGMLQQLERIARGEATDADFKELRMKFNESKIFIDEVIVGLRKSRTEIQKLSGGLEIVDRINEILYSSTTGKSSIRREIDELLKISRRKGFDEQVIVRRAAELCNAMYAFNAAVRRLDRTAND